MDVYGRNPKQNRPIEEFPTYYKWDKIPYGERDKVEWEKEQDQFYTEIQEYEEVNIGHYFRNNCWWWRPLWDFCYNIAPDLISEELWGSGHNNSGKGLDEKDARLLGNRLLQQIREGKADEFKKWHEEQEKNEEYKYPFDTDNVKKFAEFCLQSGGFKIC